MRVSIQREWESVVLLLCLIVSITPVFAQVTSGVITGVVQDGQGPLCRAPT